MSPHLSVARRCRGRALPALDSGALYTDDGLRGCHWLSAKLRNNRWEDVATPPLSTLLASHGVVPLFRACPAATESQFCARQGLLARLVRPITWKPWNRMHCHVSVTVRFGSRRDQALHACARRCVLLTTTSWWSKADGAFINRGKPVNLHLPEFGVGSLRG